MCALAVLKQAPSDAYYCKHSHLKGMHTGTYLSNIITISKMCFLEKNLESVRCIDKACDEDFFSPMKKPLFWVIGRKIGMNAYSTLVTAYICAVF